MNSPINSLLTISIPLFLNMIMQYDHAAPKIPPHLSSHLDDSSLFYQFASSPMQKPKV